MKKKVFISVTYLKDIGGISSAAYNLITNIHELYDITLCTPCNYICDKYRLPDNVTIIKGSTYLHDVIVDRHFQKGQSIARRLVRNFRRILNHYFIKQKGIENAINKINIPGKYDVAIAFGDFTYNKKENKCFDYELISNRVSADKKIAWIHNNPLELGWTKELATKRFHNFDAIVNVSFDCKNIFDSIVPEYKNKSFVVYNMYDIDKIKHLSHIEEKLYTNDDIIHFVTVARIQIKQKRIDRILKVCKQLKEDGYKNFDWTLVGSSPTANELIKSAKEMGIMDVVRFVGLQSNPYPYIKQADAFVLSSSYEGYGMTIKESQILCTPTFSTRFGAVKETIDEGKQGLICKNSTKGLYDMIKAIIEDRKVLNNYSLYLQNNPITNSLAIKQLEYIL